MKNFGKKIGIAIGVTAAVGMAYATVHRIVAGTLVREALDRDEPRIMIKLKSKITASEKFDDAVKQSEQLSKMLEMREHEVFTMQSFDGTNLKAHWFPAENPKRVLIAMHGWRSTWARDFAAIVDFWLESGCSVLLPEQRGQGESDGDYMGFGLIERHDCLEWIKWFNRTMPTDLPLYLAGISMGATTVLMTAGAPDLPENVHGVIADCGFTSPDAIWKHVAEENLKYPYGRHKKLVDRLCRQRIDTDADSYSTLDAMRVTRVPVFLIHGTADHFVPCRMSQENYEACVSPKRLLTVEGAEHGMSYLVDRETYEEMVREFFADYDE